MHVGAMDTGCLKGRGEETEKGPVARHGAPIAERKSYAVQAAATMMK